MIDKIGHNFLWLSIGHQLAIPKLMSELGTSVKKCAN
jgi:hypothetical protein